MSDDQSIRSSSPTVFDESILPNRSLSSSFFSCCQSSRRSRTNGFFHRIQIFKAKKRQSSVRKQQQIATTNIANGYLTADENRCESTCFIPPPSPYQHYHRSSIGNSPSIPSLHHYSYRHRLNEHFDAYSFNDIEMSSSTTTTTTNLRNLPRTTSKSCVSSAGTTTDLSAYSTQSLLKKLLDKAQLLDFYYNRIITKTNHQSSLSLNSTNGNGGDSVRPNPRSYSFVSQPLETKRKSSSSSSKRLRAFYGNNSSTSSQTELYHDEENVLRELIRFNNDIDLILSRLEMEGDGTTSHQPLSSTNDDDPSTTTIERENVEQ
uniref:Uncharacterized protein n=1 Tax=Philodina roseola TaxID=96448 RepID=B2ZFB1_PHIRO|nr:hypothetical protein 20 [Philodina roseola]